MRYCRKLETTDVGLIPEYARILHEGLTKIGWEGYTEEASKTHLEESEEYVQNFFNSGIKNRLIGHFTDKSLDGILIERIETIDFDHTGRKDNVALLAWLISKNEGKGIGSELLDDSITRARQEKRDAVTLTVSESNERALRFYKRNGLYELANQSGLIEMYHFLNPRMDPRNLMVEIYSQMFGE
jgi:GNAT superfamily N-acetyltransferase